MKFSEFLASSYDKPKITRAGVAKYIEELVTEGREPTLDDLAVIYKNFMPARPSKLKKNFTPFEWVASAAGKKDIRHYLNFVYADGTRIIGTDGHRLHTLIDDREPGFYCPVKGVKVHEKDWANYPDVDRVIPDISEGYTPVTNATTEYEAMVNNKLVLKISDSESYLNEKYWLEASAWGEGTITYVPTQKSKGVVIDIPEQKALAIIMPMRI